jgi:hypothetical protein
MQREFIVAHHNGMARVCAAVITNYNVAVFGEDIYDLTLAFIAPL